MKTTNYNFTVLYEKQPDGSYVASVPALPGCHTEGRNLDEAQEMVVEAIRSYVGSLIQHGEPIPEEKFQNQLVGNVQVPIELAS